MELDPRTPPDREARLASLADRTFDVAVVGGGITGAGTALDLAARGLRVALLERGDWAAATSSASSRLIHGGLRYLEHLELGLVRDSCLERALLLRNAAGLVWPESFVFPVRRGDRVGRLKLGLGLFLYTALSLPRPLGVPRILGRSGVLAHLPGADPARLTGGGSYLDGATDDARLTLAVVRTALARGVTAVSRAEVLDVDAGERGVEVSWRDAETGAAGTVRAACCVLAGGPFADGLRRRAGLAGRWIAPTRGTHVIVPRDRLPTDGAVILPSDVDGRILFFIPWPRHTVIGTTDLDADPDAPVRATGPEVRYLLDSANGVVPSAELGPDDVVSTWAGLRPLLAADEASPSARSREERVAREGRVFTIAGGKLTGYRSMAESLGAEVARFLGRGDASRHSPTRSLRLVGSEAAPVPRPAWSRAAAGVEPGAARAIAWGKRYGSLVAAVEARCAAVPEGERALDDETRLGEVDWACEHEDLRSPDDFYLRRTDLGYGPAGRDAEVRELVLDRMHALLGWSAVDRERAAARLDAELEARAAWRGDAPFADAPGKN